MFSFEDYLSKLLTIKELRVLEKRFQIVKLLRTRLTYRQIAQKMGISTTTVVRLNQRLKIRKTRRKKTSFVKSLAGQEEKKLPWKIG